METKVGFDANGKVWIKNDIIKQWTETQWISLQESLSKYGFTIYADEICRCGLRYNVKFNGVYSDTRTIMQGFLGIKIDIEDRQVRLSENTLRELLIYCLLTREKDVVEVLEMENTIYAVKKNEENKEVVKQAKKFAKVYKYE